MIHPHLLDSPVSYTSPDGHVEGWYTGPFNGNLVIIDGMLGDYCVKVQVNGNVSQPIARFRTKKEARQFLKDCFQSLSEEF